MRLFQRISRQSACIEVKIIGQVGKSQYVVFKDGAVVIETPKGYTVSTTHKSWCRR